MNNNGKTTQGAPKIKIDINDMPIHVCPKCSNAAFSEATEIRVLSMLLSPTGKIEIMKVPIAICSMCGRKVMTNDFEKSLHRKARG